MKRISTSLIGALAVLAALGAASASAATVSGVVVHDNRAAHSFVVAERTGNLVTIHAHRLPKLGRLTVVAARRLANGTWAAERVRQGSATSKVRLRGEVTFVDQRRHEFVVSARGVSLLVRDRPARARKLHAAADSTLAVGEKVAVDGTFEGNLVAASEVDQEGLDRNGLDLEGKVEQVDDTNRTLTISADDSEQSGATTTVEVPASFDITKFSQGEEVELIVSPGLDGTFTLEQASDDSSSRHADNPTEIQGDDHGDEHASAEQQCATQESDPNFAASHSGLTFTQFYEENASDAGNALGRCVEATAHGSAANPSPEMQCHLEASDPNFAASHNGLSFTQFYEQGPNDANNAFGRCVNAKAQEQETSVESGGSGSGSGASAGSGETQPSSSTGTESGSTSSGTDDSTTTSGSRI